MGNVNCNNLNIRKSPSTSAPRWNSPWPKNRIALITPYSPGWYQTLYRGEPAFVSAPFLTPLDILVPDSIPDRMIIMGEPEVGQTNSRYFNGYTGPWCHRFADWLAMHAGMPRDMIPNTSNCGSGVIWFANDHHSGGFFFKNAAHKKRMRKKYGAICRLPEDLTTEEIMYVPQIGDYIFFRWKNAKASVTVSHVGIVLSVCDGKIRTIEGNSGKKVAKRSYALDDERIVGFGHPRYEEVPRIPDSFNCNPPMVSS